MIKIEDIVEIRIAKKHDRGYEVVFPDDRIIWIVKRRTIAGLLLLIKYKECSEADLAGTNDRLANIKRILSGRFNKLWIKDRYGDANKPFSELWTEEGFSCIQAKGMRGNKQYVLEPKDHSLLFMDNAKSERIQITNEQKRLILKTQNNQCNICGAILRPNSDIISHAFSKDRIKTEFDHRKPVDRNGKTTIENMQALCHYCNKCKRQMCFVCRLKQCDEKCALVTPEKNDIVLATNENIRDRITKKNS